MAENEVKIASLDVLGAVFDFLTTYFDIALESIVRGWQNRAALPPVSSYVVLTLINIQRQGTNVHLWETLDDEEEEQLGFSEKTKMLTLYDVQVDFCGQDEATVAAQATKLTMLARDALAVRFFKGQGMSCLYADDPRSLPFSNDVDQWEVRYSVTVHLSAWNSFAAQVDAFGDVNIRLENVDVHHPIKSLSGGKK